MDDVSNDDPIHAGEFPGLAGVVLGLERTCPPSEERRLRAKRRRPGERAEVQQRVLGKVDRRPAGEEQ